MYRCPIMDSNEYIGEDDMYDWDVDYPVQYMYPPNMYRMCPMFLNSYSNPCMRCINQRGYMQPPTYSPDYGRSDKMTGYYRPDDGMYDMDQDESVDLNAEDKNSEDDKSEKFIDHGESGTKIRTVDMSEIED
ncbi:hypothetical protein LN736_03835 [Clostridium sp. WLY-B-L2]|uniref:Uncharacterized protein n=1 Tax=Clostridium aromativorans TaxID=2836848 RepID=A0ABS8N498_9CLOT|nr:hypothetical protein [Clostridium aromativorans]MCC9293999.1 hypothetical protein [Clostridium aromativorans]